MCYIVLCFVVECQKPAIDNGKFACNLGSDGVYSYEDTCSIICETGYTLTGSNTRMCLSNGSWSGMDGRCQRGKSLHSLPVHTFSITLGVIK